MFNVEAYLEPCLESALSQTYENIEIIVVDDGSIDGSAAIYERYSEQYSNIRTFWQENKGQSSARNKGIEMAEGEYVAFLDSDDYISPIYIEVLFCALTRSGCPMSTVRHGVSFFGDSFPYLEVDIEKAARFEVLTEFDYQRELLYQRSWNGSVWRLCSRERALQNSFPEGIYYEDAATTYALTHGCGQVAVVDCCNLYAYRQNESGTMRGSFSLKKSESCIYVTRKMYDEITAWYPELAEAVNSRCFAINRVVFSQIPYRNKEARQAIWEELKRYRLPVLRDRCARKKERLAAAIALFGHVPFFLFCKAYRTMLHAQ